VDVRGLAADEAVVELDRALDRAVLAGLSELRVIHGVGRGVLRDAVVRHLTGHPQVAGQRLGGVGEGGRGVTVAQLA
jgi:DNA mismatch repair protein MutS2